MSNAENVIEPLGGGVPIFKQIKNLDNQNQFIGLGAQVPSAMKQRRPFSPPIKDRDEPPPKDDKYAINLIPAEV